MRATQWTTARRFRSTRFRRCLSGLNLGVEEALTYLDYASIERIIPNEGDYNSIVGKWAISIIKGEVRRTLDGLASMRSELVSMGICGSNRRFARGMESNFVFLPSRFD